MVYDWGEMKKISIKDYSNRSFGLLFFVVFFVISLWPLKSQGDLRLWAFILSLVFLVLGVLNSKFLTPLNKLWFKFRILLGSIVSPIVNTPEDAFNCFMGTEIDILVIGNCYLNKESQDKSLKKDYKIKYKLD